MSHSPDFGNNQANGLMYRLAQGASHALAIAGQDLGGKKGALMNAFGTIGAAVAGQFADRAERNAGVQTFGKKSMQGFNDSDIANSIRHDQILSRKL